MEHRNMSRRQVLITDLDEEQPPKQMEFKQSTLAHQTAMAHRTHHKRQRKTLQTLSGNFNRRSRSVDCQVEIRQQETGTGDNNNSSSKKKQQQERTLNGLLQAKEQQMEQLMQRLSTLHNYNDQFAVENEELREKNAQMERRLVQVQQQVANCGRCQQLAQKLTVCIGQNKKLVTDVEMLKTLVFRLNVQIESYQDKLQRCSQEENEPSPRTLLTSQATATPDALPDLTKFPAHTLAPLLQAYDETIKDKEALIVQYGQEFEHFTAELKRALDENTRLLQAMEVLKRDVGGWREERTCLQAQLGVCRDKAETQTRKTDLAKEKLVEVMHCYEQRTQSLLLEMDHLQAAYARTKNELATLKASGVTHSSDADAVQQCKKMLEQLKLEHSKEQQELQIRNAQLQTERTQLNARCEEMQMQQRTLQTQLDRSSAQVEELRLKSEALDRTTEKAKHARDRLKARLRIALQWAQKLEAGNAELRDTFESVRRLEVLVKHKEAQLRGLHARNIEEVDKMRLKLEQKEETIKTLLRNQIERRGAVD